MTASALLLRLGFGDTAGTRLILLGTGGGPRPRRTTMSSAQAIIVNGVLYVADCGDGVAVA